MKQPIFAENAPKPIGPYSPGIRAGDLIFISGQIGLDSKGKLVNGSINEETQQVMQNLLALLKSGGTTPENILKTTIYLTDIKDFPEVNKVYASFFKGTPPARSTIQVVNLPMGAHVEIELIANT